MKKNDIINKTFILCLSTFILSQPVIAAKKFKCWTNSEGVKECGSFVPGEYSQKRIETHSASGRRTSVEERAKSKAELAEIARLAELKKIEDEKIAAQKKKDDILLKTFSKERDINLLRDSKLNVIEGIIIVTKSNNKALNKKLVKLQKKAANIERRGNKPPITLLEDIKAIESRLAKNAVSIKSKKDEQKIIREKFAKDMQRFRTLKNKNSATKPR